MSESLVPCGECGMPCTATEYHPYAACLMFKQCKNSRIVRDNLNTIAWRDCVTDQLRQQLAAALAESAALKLAQRVTAGELLADEGPLAIAELYLRLEDPEDTSIADNLAVARRHFAELVARQWRLVWLLRHHLTFMTCENDTDDLWFHENGARVSLKEQTIAAIATTAENDAGGAQGEAT